MDKTQIEITADELVAKEHFEEYVKNLRELRDALRLLRLQMSTTSKAVETIVKSTHLNAVLTLTKEARFVSKITL